VKGRPDVVCCDDDFLHPYNEFNKGHKFNDPEEDRRVAARFVTEPE
jgi:hypothetical protein